MGLFGGPKQTSLSTSDYGSFLDVALYYASINKTPQTLAREMGFQWGHQFTDRDNEAVVIEMQRQFNILKETIDELKTMKPERRELHALHEAAAAFLSAVLNWSDLYNQYAIHDMAFDRRKAATYKALALKSEKTIDKTRKRLVEEKRRLMKGKAEHLQAMNLSVDVLDRLDI